jgi:hypothetical protein
MKCGEVRREKINKTGWCRVERRKGNKRKGK